MVTFVTMPEYGIRIRYVNGVPVSFVRVIELRPAKGA